MDSHNMRSRRGHTTTADIWYVRSFPLVVSLTTLLVSNPPMDVPLLSSDAGSETWWRAGGWGVPWLVSFPGVPPWSCELDMEPLGRRKGIGNASVTTCSSSNTRRSGQQPQAGKDDSLGSLSMPDCSD